MKRPHLSRLAVCWPLLLLLLVGCGGKSPSVAYYNLTPISAEAPEAKTVTYPEVLLGVGPVTAPEYLKSALIVTRQGANRLEFNEFHRWAGMFEPDFASILGNNLALLLGTDKVVFYPWLSTFKPDYRLVVEVIRFDGDLQGDAVLSARWMISASSGGKLLASGKSDLRQRLASPGYDALVDAESQLVNQFSRQLAGELRALIEQK